MFSAKFIFILLAALLLTACGQSGPLYLPDAEQQQQQQKDYGLL